MEFWNVMGFYCEQGMDYKYLWVTRTMSYWDFDCISVGSMNILFYQKNLVKCENEALHNGRIISEMKENRKRKMNLKWNGWGKAGKRAGETQLADPRA